MIGNPTPVNYGMKKKTYFVSNGVLNVFFLVAGSNTSNISRGST